MTLLTTAFSLCSCAPGLDALKNEYAVGKNIEDIIVKQTNNESFFEYENYCFWNEKNYDIGIHYNSEDSKVDKNLIKNKSIGSKEDLTNISRDDDIFCVVSYIGIPISCGTSGVESLIFNLEDANGCVVYLYNDNSFLKVDHIEVF